MAAYNYNQRIDKMVNDLIVAIDDDCGNYDVRMYDVDANEWVFVDTRDDIIQMLCDNKKIMDKLDEAIKIDLGLINSERLDIPREMVYKIKKTEEKKIVKIDNDDFQHYVQYLYGIDNHYFGKYIERNDIYIYCNTPDYIEFFGITKKKQ